MRNAAHFLPVACRAGSIFEHLILLVEVHLVTGLVVSAFVVGADVVKPLTCLAQGAASGVVVPLRV